MKWIQVEEQIRKRFDKQFSKVSVGTRAYLWKRAVEAGTICEVVTGEQLLEDLIDQTNERLVDVRHGEGRTLAEGREKDSQTQNELPERDVVESPLKPLERERQASLQEYLATCAACAPDVYSFRKEALDGNLLTNEEMRALVLSPAAATLSVGEFQSWNIPAAGHTAIVKERKTRRRALGETYSATLRVDPPGREIQKSVPVLYGDSGGWSPSVLQFPGKEGEIEAVRIWGKSLLDELRVIGDGLSRSYRWHPAHAARFVLTGKVPSVPALVVEREFYRSRYHEDHLIRIEAPAWVSDDTVKDAFHRARMKSLGKPPGTLKARGLALFRFVMERGGTASMPGESTHVPNSDGWLEGLTEEEIRQELLAEHAAERVDVKSPRDKGLWKEWTRLYSKKKWNYKEFRTFQRDYRRIRDAVAFGPPYQW